MSRAALHTAARIAAALGVSPRAVRLQLAAVAPCGPVFVRGQSAPGWTLSRLPAPVRAKLAESARRGFYRDEGHLLADTAPAWQPQIDGVPVEKSDLAESCLAEAERLQRALLPSLFRLKGAYATRSGSAEALGLAEYRTVFGQSISARHWWRLIDRTVKRAGADEDFSRVELFLADRVARRTPSAPAVVRGQALPAAGGLRGAVELIGPVSVFTLADKEHLWRAAVEEIQGLLKAGQSERAARAAVLRTLGSLPVPLANTRAALQKALERKWRRWTESEGRADALKDRREGRSGKLHGSPFTEQDYERTAARIIGCGGRFGQAYRELYEEGKYSPGVYQTYTLNPFDKSRVPRPLRDRFNSAVIAELLKNHRGPKEAKVRGPKTSRDWSNMPAGVQAQSDDLTAPVYFYIPLPDGSFKLLRGQFLPWIDTRTTYIHCFQLLPTESYGSVDIVRGLVQLNDVFGLPEQIAVENGIWKTSLLISGRGDDVPFKERVYGLRDLGIKVTHANDPSGKPVEYVFRLLQNRMERERGYCGRDERRDCPEAVSKAKRLVESGQCHPSEYFYSYAEWVERLNQICDAYNDEVQAGVKIGGMSPRQAFVKLQGPPPMRLDAGTRYLLASHRRIVRVTGIGVTIKIGKTCYTYKSQETGRMIGHRVLAWFDLEDPSVVTLTTLDSKNPVTVARETLVPAWRAPGEIIAQAKREGAEHVSLVKQLYSKLKKEYREELGGTYARPVVADAATRELGARMGEQKAVIKADAERVQRTRRTVAERSRRAGLQLPATDDLARLEAQRRLAELMEKPR